MDIKKCNKCLTTKSVDCFHKDKNGVLGVRASCKDCRSSNENEKAIKRDWYIRNKEKRQAQIKLHAQTYKERRRELHRERQENDINYRIKKSLRSRLYSALKNNYKECSAVSDLGCSIEFFKSYIESKFTDGMTWDNYGEWHIDHIVPISLFDLGKRDEQLKACNYKNLQPLWAEDNMRKSNKVI